MLRISKNFLSILSPIPWLFIIWSMPLFILLNLENNPITRVYHYYYLYLSATVAGIIIIFWKGTTILIALTKKKIKLNYDLLIVAILGTMIVAYVPHYINQMNLYKNDISLFENHHVPQITGKIKSITPPVVARGTTDYLYFIDINNKNLIWFRKSTPNIYKNKQYTFDYLPNTNQIIGIR